MQFIKKETVKKQVVGGGNIETSKEFFLMIKSCSIQILFSESENDWMGMSKYNSKGNNLREKMHQRFTNIN